jgi:hypothetical protein
MKKNLLNGNIIGSDNRTTDDGIIPFSKHYLQRLGNNLTPVGSGTYGSLVKDGLIFYVDFLDGASYPGSGTTLTNLGSAGDSLNWSLGGTPTFVQGNNNTDTYMNFDSIDDHGYPYTTPIGGALLTTDMTVGWIVRSTDANAGMIASKTTGGGGFLAAYSTNGNFYHNSVASPTAYIDLVSNNDSEGLDDSFHMLEFKAVDFSSWTSNIFMPAKYSGFIFQGYIKAMFMYSRSITSAESSTNYLAFQNNGYL